MKTTLHLLANPSQRPKARKLTDGQLLGDLVTPRKQKVSPLDFPDLPFVGLENVESQSTKLLGVGTSREMKSSANRFFPGDVLYSRLRPYLNKVWIADREGLCSSEFIVLPQNEALDAKYLCYRLNSSDFVAFANNLNTGDRPRVDFDQIADFKIEAPGTLKSQNQIIAAIRPAKSLSENGGLDS